MALSQSSYDAFNAKAQAVALDSVRKAVVLPNDIAFHRSVDLDCASQLDSLSARVLKITNRILELSQFSNAPSSSGTSSKKGKEKEIQRLGSQDDVLDSFQSIVVDVVDQLFERTDTCLDEYLGRSKPVAIAINPTLPATRKPNQGTTGKRGAAVVQHATYLSKPQLSFKTPPDNSVDTPWYPTLTHKYNAKVPLGFICEGEPEEPWKRHPYRYEIVHVGYPSSMFLTATPTTPTPLPSSPPLTFVTTSSELRSMLDILRTSDAIAVDLEHHDHRSYRGIVCLMQISTRDRDWIVDTLVPDVREELGTLNEVFTDPRIVKVFHGAESDIIWLQRDFSLYIVNMFDTFHASKVLDFPRHGLANLLEMYCDFTPDKQYQLADWRIRPLPEAMINYARSDTHFLLFIYDNLRNALLDRGLSQSRNNSRSASPSTTKKPSKSPSPPTNGSTDESGYPPHALLNEVLSRSSTTALRVYEREVYDELHGTGPGGWEGLAKKWNKGGLLSGDNEQGRVYRAVHAWRDRVAREQDESPRFVLANHHIFQFAEHPPQDMAGLLTMFPSSRVPPLVRARARELLDVVLAAVRGGGRSVDENSMVVDEEAAITKAGPAQLLTSDPPTSMVDPSVPGQDLSNRIWSLRKSSDAKPTSVLFGPARNSATGQSKEPRPSYIAKLSSLLGKPATKQSDGVSNNREAHFAAVLGKIHSSLTIMPTAPQIPAVIQETLDDDESVIKTSTTLAMEAEIPFVPAAERKTRVATEVEEDTIIVVGQRSKKRKRKDNKSIGQEGDEEASGSALPRKVKKTKDSDAEEGEEKPFDFSTVPNILDDTPVVEAEAVKRKREKKKQNKGGSFGYGDFPRPPKAHSELRSGNQSHTFRK